MRHVAAGWGLRRCLWFHDVQGPLAYMRLTEDYGLHGRAQTIRCPTLVCRAQNDDIGVTAPKLFNALTFEKAFILFTTAEGAGEHYEAGGPIRIQ